MFLACHARFSLYFTKFYSIFCITLLIVFFKQWCYNEPHKNKTSEKGSVFLGEKDKTEKYLENYNDVFADIFNVLLFKKKWIRKNKLRSIDKESLYKAAGGDLKLQERDILKE